MKEFEAFIQRILLKHFDQGLYWIHFCLQIHCGYLHPQHLQTP